MNLGIQPLRAVFGEVSYDPGGRFGPRIQRDLQLVLLLRGSASIEVEDAIHFLPAGSAMLLLPGRREFFQFSREEQTRHTWCAVHYPPLPAAILNGFARKQNRVEISPRMHDLVRMGLELREASPAAEALRRKLAEACLWEFFFLTGGEAAPGVPPSLLRVQAFVQEHLAEEMDLAMLAEVGSVTPAHLVRLFRQHMEVTPVRYLWRARLAEGLRMLRETGLSVSEAAYRSGFRNPFHFSRLVKAETGQTPTAYRERVWRKAPERKE